MAACSEATIVLPKLHRHQAAIFRDPARFKVLVCGRGFGKSTLALTACLAKACVPYADVWYVGPSFPDVDQQWTEFQAMLPGDFAGRWNLSRKRLELANGSRVIFKSAHVGEGRLRGGQRRFVVVDEAGSIPDLADIWRKAIRPSLTRFQGSALFVGTPRGHNYFTTLYTDALAKSNTDWQAWCLPSSANPWLPAEEIAVARAELPDLVFRQEYLAEVIADGGTVFRRINAAIRPDLPRRPYTGHFAIGVDWAKRADFTVFVVIDMDTGEVVAIDRFNQIDYDLQVGRLAALAAEWQPTVILAEQNSIGEPLIEQLQRMGLPVQGFMTTYASKPPLIEDLSLGFEQGLIGIPDDPILRHELQAFTVEIGKNARPQYAGAKGSHDDLVIALALAWHCRLQPRELVTWV